MRRILFLFLFFLLLILPLLLITSPVTGQEIDNWQRRQDIFIENLTDEMWPHLWFNYHLYWQLEHRDYNPDFHQINKLNNEGQDALTDTIKDVLEDEIKRWKVYKKLRKWLKKRIEVKMAVYPQQLGEDETTKKLTFDFGWEVDEGKHHLLDAGFRLRTDPALYLKYHWLRKGELEHDWSWYPTKDQVEYRLEGLPLDLDFKFRYNYQQEKIKCSLEDWRITGRWRFSFSTSYQLSDEQFGIKGLFYTTF